MQLGVTSIPTMVIFHAGTEIHRYVGLQPAGVLTEALDEALALAKAKENREAPAVKKSGG
jgi:thioredoxin-like negative regulator of GroEL